MCPHCMLAMLGASLVAVKTVPLAIPFIKDKFSRQDAMRKNFGVLYGKKREDHASR